MGCRDNLIDVLKKKNMTLVASEAHNLQDKDFTSQILNVKKSGATAVVMVSGVPALGIMVKQARQPGARCRDLHHLHRRYRPLRGRGG